MARLNTKNDHYRPRTHGGALAHNLSAEQRLERSVMSCMLFEGEFYEDGQSIAKRIWETAQDVSPSFLAGLAVRAREQMNLRHAPLMLLSALAKIGSGSSLVGDTIARVIKRADEPGELLAIHAKMNGVSPHDVKPVISAQMKRGIATALRKFDAYQLAKYNRDTAIKLRDVIFLTHPKPVDDEQANVWRDLINGQLAAPDTWEVGLSSGGDKHETFTRLLKDGKLGYLALLRNLRNMSEAGVEPQLVRQAIIDRKGAQRVLPFRYVAAARAAPRYERELDKALLASIDETTSFDGETIILVDVSASMRTSLSARSDLTRMDAAATLASVFPGNVRVFTFSSSTVEVPPRRGISGVDTIKNSQRHSMTNLADAIRDVNKLDHDRLIVITDEQATGNSWGNDTVPDARVDRAYMINVASAEHGVGYGAWTHIDGFSEQVLNYIKAYEAK